MPGRTVVFIRQDLRNFPVCQNNYITLEAFRMTPNLQRRSWEQGCAVLTDRIQAFNYGKFLSEHGVQVISGMAAGIDAEATRVPWKVVPRPLPCWEMVWTSVILHPAEVFTGGSPKKTEGSSANMNQVPKAGHIIFRQGTGSSADWQIWCLWWKQKKRADH